MSHSSELDGNLASELLACSDCADFSIVYGDTMCTSDFYEGQLLSLLPSVRLVACLGKVLGRACSDSSRPFYLLTIFLAILCFSISGIDFRLQGNLGN